MNEPVSSTPGLFSWRNLRGAAFVVIVLLTLVALAWTEENWRGRHAWLKHRRQWEARGEKFNLVALAPPLVPDEKNFALTPLLRPVFNFSHGPTGLIWHDTNALAHLQRVAADLPPNRRTNNNLVPGNIEKGTFADLAACAAFYRGNTNYLQTAAGASAAEVILAALAQFDPEFKELQEAARTRTRSRFPIEYESEPSWGILLPHLARIKGLTTLTHVRATAELELGRSSEALEDLKLGLRLSDCIREEPFLIDHLVRIAALGIGLQTLREGLVRHAWSDAQLADLQRQLASVNLLAEYEMALRGERALSTSGLDYLRRQGFLWNPSGFAGDEIGASEIPFNLMPSGWFYQNMLTISRMLQDSNLPAVDGEARRVFPLVSDDGTRALQNVRAGPYTIFAKLLLPALEKAIRRSARMQTHVDAARVACALERHRLATHKLPDTLAPLVPEFIDRIPNDVIDGQPLRYRRTAEATYLLWSIGWNRTDDGGVTAWLKGKEPSADIAQGDWVWEMAAR